MKTKNRVFIFPLMIMGVLLTFSNSCKKSDSTPPPSFSETDTKIYDTFETNILNSIWFSNTSGLGGLTYLPLQSQLSLSTGQYRVGGGSANVISIKQFSLSNGTLTFEGAFQPYEDNNSAYGDGQPRGLASGTDRTNAIEFISKTGSSIAARTVKNNVATETLYSIGSTVNYMRTYRIVASSSTVKFYLNGTLIATHTTNIPTTPLNVYFGSGWIGAGNVPMSIDFVSYEITNN